MHGSQSEPTALGALTNPSDRSCRDERVLATEAAARARLAESDAAAVPLRQDAIRHASLGDRWGVLDQASQALERARRLLGSERSDVPLSQRQVEVLRHLARGLT